MFQVGREVPLSVLIVTLGQQTLHLRKPATAMLVNKAHTVMFWVVCDVSIVQQELNSSTASHHVSLAVQVR